MREEGRDRGREERREEGEFSLVLLLLEQRIGAVASADQQRIRALDCGRLTTLAAASGAFSEPRKLDAWLARDD